MLLCEKNVDIMALSEGSHGMLSAARSPGKGLHHGGCATMAFKNAELYLQWAPESLWQGANA